MQQVSVSALSPHPRALVCCVCVLSCLLTHSLVFSKVVKREFKMLNSSALFRLSNQTA
jgi:hypothetical protein